MFFFILAVGNWIKICIGIDLLHQVFLTYAAPFSAAELVPYFLELPSYLSWNTPVTGEKGTLLSRIPKSLIINIFLSYLLSSLCLGVIRERESHLSYAFSVGECLWGLWMEESTKVIFLVPHLLKNGVREKVLGKGEAGVREERETVLRSPEATLTSLQHVQHSCSLKSSPGKNSAWPILSPGTNKLGYWEDTTLICSVPWRRSRAEEGSAVYQSKHFRSQVTEAQLKQYLSESCFQIEINPGCLHQ